MCKIDGVFLLKPLKFQLKQI